MNKLKILLLSGIAVYILCQPAYGQYRTGWRQAHQDSVTFKEQASAPSTPVSGIDLIYVDSSSVLRYLNNNGTDTSILTSGTNTASPTFDNLIILVPDGNDANINFGSPSDSIGSQIRWNHDADLMTIGTRNAGASISFITADGSEAMRIDSNGRVGIGTDTLVNALDIFAASAILRLHDSGAIADATLAFMEFGGTNGSFVRTGYIGDSSSSNTNIILQAEIGDLILGDSSGINVLKLQSGNAGIGTSTVNKQMDIWEGGTSTCQIDFNDVASSTALVLWNRADNAMVRVTVGENDTGGSGFRSLHIPNL